MPRKQNARSLLFFVTALFAAATLAPIILVIVATQQWAVAEQNRLQLKAGESASAVIETVDRYLAGKIAMLQALATSPALDEADFKRLDRQSRELLDLQGLNIVVRDREGQQKINTRVPWGASLPRIRNLEADHRVFESKQPYITGRYPGVMAGGPLIRLIVPVLRDDQVKYTLTASLPPSALGSLLEAAPVSAPYRAQIVDRAGELIASTNPEVTPFSPEGSRPPGSNGLAIWNATAHDPAFAATTRRSPLSGWVFTIEVDRQVIAPVYRSLWLLAGTAFLLGMLAFSIATALGRRMVRAHRQLVSLAEALGNGEVVAPPATSLKEANVVGEAMAAASVKLAQQAAALIEANTHLEQRIEERTTDLQLALHAAEEASRAKGHFLATMSHELRTPLNAVIGYSAMLVEDAEAEGRAQDTPDLLRINSAGKHLLALVDDILDLSKVEAGRMELHLERVGVRELLEDVVATCKPAADRNGNSILLFCKANEIVGDKVKLRQCLLNLLSNACKFTQNGEIKISARADENALCFEVEDTGIGIDRETLPKLFSNFVQADAGTRRKYGGTGLGLALSQKLCQLMGGHISVESEPGLGTCFTIHLPGNAFAGRAVLDEVGGSRPVALTAGSPVVDQAA